MPCPAKSDLFAVDHSNPLWVLLRCRVGRCSLVRMQRIVQLAIGPAAAQVADQVHRVDEAGSARRPGRPAPAQSSAMRSLPASIRTGGKCSWGAHRLGPADERNGLLARDAESSYLALEPGGEGRTRGSAGSLHSRTRVHYGRQCLGRRLRAGCTVRVACYD